MTTYYVSKYGSDANNGLGPDASAASNKPWLTIGKALGASGIASGDTVYVGPGIYRENVTVSMTGPTVATTISGDPQNVQGFKDNSGGLVAAGEVQWNAYTVNDFTDSTGRCLSTVVNFLSFVNIVFMGGRTFPSCVSLSSSTNLTFTDCAFLISGNQNQAVTGTVGAGVAANWTFTRCYFVCWEAPNASGGNFLATLTRHTADYDANIVISNCVFVGGGNGAQIKTASTGAGSGFGGGVYVLNCTMVGSVLAVQIADANLSTTFPVIVNNCIISAGVGLSATTSGQITENYNVFYCGTARTNVTAGAQSVSQQYALLLHAGQERIWGGQARRFGEPTQLSPFIGFGSAAAGAKAVPTVDMLNRNRPSGVNLGSSGQATAGAAKTLTDSGKAWGVNQWAGWVIQITAGTGSGQTKSITSNTATVITVDGNWKTNPDNTSTYQVYWGDLSSTGKATAGAASTMTDSNAAWGTNQWAGYTLEIDGGTGSGQTATIASNTGTVLTRSGTWGTNPDNTSTYKLYKATGVTTQDYAVGAYERHDIAQRETTTTDVGGVGIRIVGAGDQQIVIPVNAVSTIITIRVRFDSAHGTTTRPQATLIANGEIGVTTETVTAAGSAGAWETLTFAAFTPTAKGFVTIRLISRAAASNGIAYFDTFTCSPPASPNDLAYFNRGEVMPFAGPTGGAGELINSGALING